MLYMAIIILMMKYVDVLHTLRFHEADGSDSFGVSVGTLVLATESFLLTMYVTSCHAFRHLIGGGNRRWSLGMEKLQGSAFRFVSKINVHHGFWFWTSLAMVFLGDIFVWAVAEGVLSDPSFRI